MSRAVVWLSLLLVACAGPSRFALRAPITRDHDDRPFSPAPEEDEEAEVANGVDQIVLRPLADVFTFQTFGEAHNVNALDEVPDSSWFENRRVTPAELRRGPCAPPGLTPPLVVLRGKSSGDTPGFMVEDAHERRFLIKLDPALRHQREISTAADAVASRLYWASGFHAPCNDVEYVPRSAFVIDARSQESGRLGRRRPLTRARLDGLLDRATLGPDGSLRVLASRFIEGRPIGGWRTEGTREDDPNDVIAHEDRRELRGERLLAAWVGHWDSRGPNTFDAYVETEGGGHVVHYFLDFGDCIGANPSRTPWPEPRVGFATVLDGPTIVADALTFGFIRRPWDEVRFDPRYPNLGYFGIAHFEPLQFTAQVPLERWERAQPQDLAWMARRIARLSRAHVAAAASSARFSDAAETRQLTRVLMGRRRRILTRSFREVSPLSDVRTTGPRTLCARDLSVTSGITPAHDVRYGARMHVGERRLRTRPLRFAEGRVCVELPESFAPASAPDDDARRYAIVELGRWHEDTHQTLRVHLYDLGPDRGYRLAGLERP